MKKVISVLALSCAIFNLDSVSASRRGAYNPREAYEEYCDMLSSMPIYERELSRRQPIDTYDAEMNAADFPVQFMKSDEESDPQFSVEAGQSIVSHLGSSIKNGLTWAWNHPRQLAIATAGVTVFVGSVIFAQHYFSSTPSIQSLEPIPPVEPVVDPLETVSGMGVIKAIGAFINSFKR